MNIEEITRRVFAKLGQEKQLREYHEIIYKLIGVVVDFISADGVSLKLSEGKHFNPCCTKIRNTEAGYAACGVCDTEYARRAARSGKPLVYTCHAGFLEILVPLYDNAGNYIGSMTAGQFHRKDTPVPGKSAIAARVREFGLDLKEMFGLYRQTLRLSEQQIEGLIEYLETIGRLLVSTRNNLLFMESVNAPDRVSLIKEFVEKNYGKRLSVPKIARRFYMSPGYFSHFFKKEVGVSFQSYLNLYRVSKAKEMLEDTELSVSEIACLTGFGSISQFNRTFRNSTGKNPGSIRK